MKSFPTDSFSSRKLLQGKIRYPGLAGRLLAFIVQIKINLIDFVRHVV